MRALAAEFPGALRELDTLSSEALEARLATVESMLVGAPGSGWVERMYCYHVALRAALAVKRDLGSRSTADETTLAERYLVAPTLVRVIVERPPRLSVAVARWLELQLGLDPDTLLEELFPGRKR